MKIRITNSLKEISFHVNGDGEWYIRLNNVLLCRSSPYSCRRYTYLFNTLKEAVNHAKAKGYIPKDFDLKALQTDLEIEINT